MPAVTYFLATTLLLAYHRRRAPPSDDALAKAWPGGVPKVSILKPCKGADPGFDENLRSFLRQDGVPNEVLVAFTTDDDPGYAIARRVLDEEKHPAASLHLVPARPGSNPKVVNLVALAERATGSVHLVADSNVRADPGVLRRLVLELADPNVAAATLVFKGVPGATVAAKMQAALFGILLVPALSGAYLLFRVGNIIGKCFAYKVADLDALGGWKTYADRLVEDAPFSRDLQRRGRRVVVAPGPVEVHVGDLGWEAFRLHEERWWILNRTYNFPTVLGAMWWNPVVLSLLASGFAVAGTAQGARMLAATAASNFVLQCVLHVRMGGRVSTLWVLPLEQVYLLWHHVRCWFADTVVWRGVRYRLGTESRILPIEPDPR